MPGLRIHYSKQEAWGQTVVVKHPGDPRTGRKAKDYFLRLDSDGNVIVSTTIWHRLEEIRTWGLNHNFVFLNMVEDPPTQGIGNVPEQPRRLYRQEQDALHELTPPGMRSRVVRNMDANKVREATRRLG